MKSSLNSYIASDKASESKREIFNNIHKYLYPGRVERLLKGGIDFVPDKRSGYVYWDKDGKELFDLHLNGGTFNLGHCHPELVDLLKNNCSEVDIGNHHFPSEHKATLAQSLIESIPGDMQYVVFTSSGSEANDVAIKSARWSTGRKKVLSVDCAYHGRTGFSGTAGNKENATYFSSDNNAEFFTVPFNDIDAAERVLSKRDIAIFMMEVIPATNGFCMPEKGYLQAVQRLCKKYGTLFLADEVQTGLGRTGKAWAVECWDVEPDILVTGKGLSGGLYPMAAAIMTDAAGAWLRDNGWGHVSTFGGSDLGCVIANKALELSTSKSTLENVNNNAQKIRAGLERVKKRFPFFTGIRQQGLIFGLEFNDSTYGQAMVRALYENGIWAINAGFDESVVQFKPGLLIDDEYVETLLQRFESACIWLVKSINDIIMESALQTDACEKKRVTDLGLEALKQWGLNNVQIDLLKHRENAVFKITDQNSNSYALRIHRAGYHSDEALLSELQYIEHLSKTGFNCPAPIKTNSGDYFTQTKADNGNSAQNCSLISWIEGKSFADLGRVENGMTHELKDRYFKLGVAASQLHTLSENWNEPTGFFRQSWDAEGLLGDDPIWGKFWEHPVVTKTQKRAFLKSKFVLKSLLGSLPKDHANYGLVHADFLPENVLKTDTGLALIDFDDSGYSWYLFEMATSLFPHLGMPYFDALKDAYIAGYRTNRHLDQKQLELLPAFLMIRGFAYIGWLMTRSDSLINGDKIAQAIAEGLHENIPLLMNELSLTQRLGVEAFSLASEAGKIFSNLISNSDSKTTPA